MKFLITSKNVLEMPKTKGSTSTTKSSTKSSAGSNTKSTGRAKPLTPKAGFTKDSSRRYCGGGKLFCNGGRIKK